MSTADFDLTFHLLNWRFLDPLLVQEPIDPKCVVSLFDPEAFVLVHIRQAVQGTPEIGLPLFRVWFISWVVFAWKMRSNCSVRRKSRLAR